MGSCLSTGAGTRIGAGATGPSAPPPLPPSFSSSAYYHHLLFRSECDAETSCAPYISDSSIEMQLHRVPGRIFLNGSSDVASLCSKKGRSERNQDAMILWENFCSMEDTVFCGVFDGHGTYGHMVSKKVRDCLPLKLIDEWNLYDATNISALKESFLKACKVMDKELQLDPNIDCYNSGTTAVTLMKQGNNLVIANVGDSRAVLGTRNKDGFLNPLQLTTDMKPNIAKESERIRACKGRVFAQENEPDVTRVWHPNVDSPGLALTRAFGDFCVKDFGVISVPDLSHHKLTDDDQFVVLATDGIWDVLSNKQVVDIVASAPQRSSAARLLVDKAIQQWNIRLPNSNPDDCAAVCLFFHSQEEEKEKEGASIQQKRL